MSTLVLSAHPAPETVIPPAIWQRVQALAAQLVLPRRRAPLVPAFAQSLPDTCAHCLVQVGQLSLPHACAIWVLPAALLASHDGEVLRQFLLQKNWLDIVMPLTAPGDDTLAAPFWLLLLRADRRSTLIALVGARPGCAALPWSMPMAAGACMAFWKKFPHPGYLPLTWDVVLYQLGRFGLGA